MSFVALVDQDWNNIQIFKMQMQMLIFEHFALGYLLLRHFESLLYCELISEMFVKFGDKAVNVVELVPSERIFLMRVNLLKLNAVFVVEAKDVFEAKITESLTNFETLRDSNADNVNRNMISTHLHNFSFQLIQRQSLR